MDEEMKIKPSGKMPVAPKNGGRKPNEHKHNIFGAAGATALAMMAVAVILIRFVYTANESGEFGQKQETAQNKSENAKTTLEDIEICGFWSAVDCVGNIGDFDPKNPYYAKKGQKLVYYRAEFFEDGIVTIKYSDFNAPANSIGETNYRWANGDELGILSGVAEFVRVCEIKSIGGKDYMFAEFADQNLMPEAMQGYYVFLRNKPKYVYPGDDIRGKDLRNYDFTQIADHMNSVSFNESAIFPRALQKTAQAIMERGTNPGLGICGLHERGITGKGVNVAIIDEPLDMGHPEYRGKIVEYKDFGSGAETSFQGPAVAGILAGETMGTAPGANIYYAAVPAWEMYDAQYYASALDWIVEINRELPEDGKIKVVCISPNPENPLPWINVESYLFSFMQAEKEGILVLDCTNEHGAIFGACSLDYENPEDVSLCKPKGAYRIAIAPYHYDGEAQDIYIDEEEPRENMLRVPISCKTLPETSEGAYSYRYDAKGQLSWALPYAAGVLAMGWQLRPDISGDEMAKILFETAYTDKKGNKYIYPGAFVEYMENHGAKS